METQKPTRGKDFAQRGVEAAARFLERNGYEVVETNWQCEAGEIEIVALEESTICFVEVQVRNQSSSLPQDTKTETERQRFEKIAIQYLKHSPYEDVKVRFDKIALVVIREGRALLRHHINCFG